MFGQFHIQLSLFSLLGKNIKGSGGPYILTEAGIIAMGSMNKFLKGKMYNRCKNCHTKLSTAMQGLHFERFLEDVNIPEEKLQELKSWCITKQNKEP